MVLLAMPRKNDSKVTIPKLADESVRKDLARVVCALLDKWDLPGHQQLALLGLSPESLKLLPGLRKGERALANSRDVLDRAGYLLGIHKGLRLLFPENPEILYTWVKRANDMLGGRTPLQVMIEDGLVGLARIARFVAFQRGQ